MQRLRSHSHPPPSIDQLGARDDQAEGERVTNHLTGSDAQNPQHGLLAGIFDVLRCPASLQAGQQSSPKCIPARLVGIVQPTPLTWHIFIHLAILVRATRLQLLPPEHGSWATYWMSGAP
jgi:hypothetical protein